jgi:hypothetical protein
MVKSDGGRQESDGGEPPVIASGGAPIDRVIYTTIALMSILIVYDTWATLRFWGVVAVIVGPMLAIFLGHIFGAALGTRG